MPDALWFDHSLYALPPTLLEPRYDVPISAHILQAQMARMRGELMAYQRVVEGSLELLIQTELRRLWLELHQMPTELAAAEADDGPIPLAIESQTVTLDGLTQWPRVQFLDPAPMDERDRQIADWLVTHRGRALNEHEAALFTAHMPLMFLPARALYERFAESLLRGEDWWVAQALPDQALSALDPRREGDNTARVEAVLRETGGHDLTGMSAAEVEAYLDTVFEPDEQP